MSQNPNQVKQALDSVSPSFCLAKWTQVTIHLHNGMTHSCHHPIPRRIPVSELVGNPSALHNTRHKIEQRAMMLKGERPEECNYCWRIEGASKENVSDRVIKSSFGWSFPFKDEILHDPLSDKIIPRYVEINLGSICNFKCSYCSPEVSTRWMAEIKQYGSYPTSGRHPVLNPESLPIPEGEENPYMEAWWKWWPDLYPHLHTFRITGGEPLLNDNFYRILDWVRVHPNPNLVLAVNTNLGSSSDAWTRFVQKAKEISESGSVKTLQIYTSAEAWGERAEYIRHGMNFELWRGRIWELLEELPRVPVTIMATYNALSVTSFNQLLEEVLRIKSMSSFYNQDRLIPIFLDVSYLRYPEHQTIKILPQEFKSYIMAHVEFMKANPETQLDRTTYKRGFMPFETHKMERILSWFLNTDDKLDLPSTSKVLKNDFFKFFTEHDRRRNTDILKVFPELNEFWTHLRTLSES